jgi:protease-4
MNQDGGGRSPRRRWGCLLLLLFLAGAVAFGSYLASLGPRVEAGSVLVLDLRDELAEKRGDGLLDFFQIAPLDVMGLRRALESAARDERILGVLLRTSTAPGGAARVEEVRALLYDFRRSGKPVIAYSEGADSFGYLLATAADEVLLERSAPLHLIGLRLSALFLAELLERWGIDADLVRVGEYKGTFEQLTSAEPSEAFSEAMNSLADSLHETLVEGIARSRGLDAVQVRNLIDRAPLSAATAKEAKLADDVIYRGELVERVESRIGKDPRFIDAATYLQSIGAPAAEGRRVAVMHLVGIIVDGETEDLPLVGAATGAETVIRALQQVERDPAFAAAVLRIDSPGGTVTAAEKIWYQVERTARIKPVVASFGDIAASGGYYAAAGASSIVAHSASLTGSIGVFGGKVVFERLLAEQGLRVVGYERGRNAGLFAASRRFSPAERRVVEEMIEENYREFVTRIAQGRKKEFDEVDRLARGRVWTGSQALESGLVDRLGGLPAAFAEVRTHLAVPADAPLEIVLLPQRPRFWDILRRRRPELSAAGSLDARSLVEGARQWLRRGLLDGRSGLVLMPFRPVFDG